MGANFSASSATDTFFGRQTKRCDIFQISVFHSVLLYAYRLFINTNTIPAADERAMSGTAIFISLITPEKDVYVDEPVKFIARNADNDGNTSKYPMARSKNPGTNQPLNQINPTSIAAQASPSMRRPCRESREEAKAL